MKKFKYYTPIFMQKLGYIVFWPLHKFFVKIEIKGRENLEKINGPIVIAANHTSELDTVAVHLALPFFSKFYPIYYVTDPTDTYKTYGWRSYVYGAYFFSLFGGYPVHSGRKDYAFSLQDHLALLKKGHTVLMYPEGIRTKDGKMNPARGGLGFTVFDTKATVVPLAVDTFFNMTTSQYFLRQRKVILTILPGMTKKELFQTESPTVEDYRGAGQKVLDRIEETLRG